MPPQTWVVAPPESRELLALCLKKLRGMGRVRIIDASFIWTEPHSRRIKVKITVQDAVGDGVLMQQTFEVVYIVATQQCPDCAKSYTANVWRACVQVRQKVLHKRTFLYLEQLMLKHGAHKDTINIKEVKDGIDFFFAARNQAEKFVDFLKSVVPVHMKRSQELISEDQHTSKKSYKFAFSVEIVPICKDDLVCLPIRIAKSLGNISPLVLCSRIGTSVYFVDPNTLQTAPLEPDIYWRAPFVSLADAPSLVEFMVLNIELTGVEKGRWAVADVEVTRVNNMETSYHVRTHLGRFLQVGDSVMGYMITGTNFNSDQFEAMEASHTYGQQIPDVVLVKKYWPRKRKNRNRNWRLKRMNKDEGDLLPKKADQEKMDNEYELFLRDVEEDEELRAALALYKSTNKTKKVEGAMDVDSVAETEGSEDEDIPQVNMDELLEDFDELTVEDKK